MVRESSRHSLRALLSWLAAAGLIVVVTAGLIVGFGASEVSRKTDRAVAVYEPASEDVSLLSLATSEMERGLSLYVLGGHEEDLRPFVNGERHSDLALESLERLVGSDPDVRPLLRDAQRSRDRWLNQVARPAIKDVRDGNEATAQALVLGRLSETLYDNLITDTDTLRHTINAERSAVFAELSDLSGRLVKTLVGVMVALLLALVVAGLLLLKRVLNPLDDLRRQIREVARRGNHEMPIVPGGPREIAAVGRDAEVMRRQLVSEIDEARSAREALEHRAPLVAAIRRELSTPTDPTVNGVRVHGEVRAAEGVLAGDWWDCVAMPDGSAALVITDVAGHGPEAGVAAMRIKHILALLLGSGTAPEEAIGVAARTFTDEVGRFATVAIVCVHPVTGRVLWVNAGHHPPVLVRGDGQAQELTRTGPLLSWIGGPWHTRTTGMDDSDVLLAFSDGLVESHADDGRQLDVAGLLGIYGDVDGPGVGIDEAVSRTLARARERATDWARDDITLVALQLVAPPRVDPTVPRPRPHRNFGKPYLE